MNLTNFDQQVCLDLAPHALAFMGLLGPKKIMQTTVQLQSPSSKVTITDTLALFSGFY
jgi:hypothetical protein